MAFCPAEVRARAGAAETAKSARLIARESVVLCVLLVPVTVKARGFGVVAERPLTVTVLVWPALIDVGLKVQLALAPPAAAQVRLMLPVKLLRAMAVT